MRIYRIADNRHPVWDGTGAALVGGRWNSVGKPVIYASASYACAMLEVLAHAGVGRLPREHRYVVVDVPDDAARERYPADSLPPGWDLEDCAAARQFGDRWLEEGKSALIIIPSVVAKIEWNVLINPRHPHAARLQPSAPLPVMWDSRLFSSRTQ